jgi:hypothetical protein
LPRRHLRPTSSRAAACIKISARRRLRSRVPAASPPTRSVPSSVARRWIGDFTLRDTFFFLLYLLFYLDTLPETMIPLHKTQICKLTKFRNKCMDVHKMYVYTS